MLLGSSLHAGDIPGDRQEALRADSQKSLAFNTTSTAAQNGPPAPRSVDAIQGIVSAFRQHPIVIIAEDHWLQQAGDFYVRLVRDKQFDETVQDIVIEFASRDNQALLDKYVSGAKVSPADVKHIWRDTSKAAGWESPIYAHWLAAIRQVNEGLPPSRRLRVLAGDTSVDWSKIHTHAEWAALGDNNISFTEVIANEVLAKKHRGLVVLGANHVRKSGASDGGPNTTTRIESRYPGSTFVVLLDYWGLLTPDVQNEIDSLNRDTPLVYPLAGTQFGETSDKEGVPLIKRADALLYLGPPDGFTLAFPARGSLEPTYLEEIDRRSMIEWGELRARKFLGPAAQ
jgi:hypothetical protein